MVNRKEIKSKRKGTKTAPRPKYLSKKILISVPIGPWRRKENTPKIAKIIKKMKKIDLTVSGLSFKRGKILFFLRPRGIWL